MKRAHSALLMCQLALGLVVSVARPSAAALPLEQEVQAGRGFVNAFVDQYGVSENQKYRELAQGVLTRLAQASGERPELQWRAVVLKHNANNPVGKNASAWPGGQIVTDDEFLKTLEASSAGDEERLRSLLAGVLAHEMAHVIRHDTDALVPVFFKTPEAPPAHLLNTLKSTGDTPKTNADEQRTKENESDRHGAFYLLRAGYRIEDMINVFRRLADEEVDEVLFSSDLDHARAGERVGNLLEIKSQVINDERLYDEAVNILRLGLDDQMLNIAEQNLQMVAQHFPNVLPVRHARAVLLHRRYLSKTPPRKLVHKPSFSFYRFRTTRSVFLEDFLTRALQEYEAILKDYEAEGYKGLGPTAAAYALGLAQAKDLEKAQTWARRAVDLAPDDWNSYNVLGIVLHKMGQSAEAVVQLRKALSLAAPELPRALVERALLTSAEERAVWRYVESQAPVDFGPALYNLALALKDAGDKDGAAHAFQAYLATDAGSDWATMAREQLPELGASPPASALPVGGVTAGLTDVNLREKIGDPDAINALTSGWQVWRYKEKGFSLFLDDSHRVRAGLLYAPFAGDLGGGARVGAGADQVEKAWGKPVATLAANGREAWGYAAQGLTFLMEEGKLAKAVWCPAPPAGTAEVSGALQIRPGDTAEQVRKALQRGPDTGDGEEQRGGVWVYDDLGLRLRFDAEAKVALVTITRPNTTAVAGVKLGDSPSRIRQVLGSGFATSDVDNAETLNFPDKGLAYIIRNAEVSIITLFPKQV